jgi:hypothetical protein
MTNYDEMVADKKAQYGGKFDPSDLDPRFVQYFNSGERIRVETTDGDAVDVRTGTVGVTTGWRPAFLLIHRVDASSLSLNLLLPDDNHRVTAVKRGESYEAIGG